MTTLYDAPMAEPPEAAISLSPAEKMVVLSGLAEAPTRARACWVSAESGSAETAAIPRDHDEITFCESMEFLVAAMAVAYAVSTALLERFCESLSSTSSASPPVQPAAGFCEKVSLEPSLESSKYKY